MLKKKEKTTKKEKLTFKSFMKDFISCALTFSVTMAAYHFTFTHLLQKSVVEGSSMEPTLYENDTLISTKIFDPDQGDIVIIKSEKLGKDIVKRVIALEGQTVDIDFDEGIVYVDGEPLNEQLYNEGEELHADYFVNTLTTNNQNSAAQYPIVVPEGYIFVLGDNRNASLDSKSNQLGFVPVDEITSEVVVRTHPINDMKLF